MDATRTTPIKLKRDFSQMDPAQDPARFAQELVMETAEQVSSVIARSQEAAAVSSNLRKAFYEKNKDLVGYEIEVGHFSNEVQSSNPGLAFDQAAEIIAQKTRDYVKSKGLRSEADPNDPNPPHALPPSSGGGAPVPIKPPSGSNEPFNQEKVYDEDMKDYAKMRSSERSRNIVVK